jgi:hypothetical protein
MLNFEAPEPKKTVVKLQRLPSIRFFFLERMHKVNLICWPQPQVAQQLADSSFREAPGSSADNHRIVVYKHEAAHAAMNRPLYNPHGTTCGIISTR